MQKVFISILLIFALGFSGVAQTKIIAHKSHSGSMNSFNPQEYSDNFGLPDFDYRTVIKASDSCLIRIGVYASKTDTICGAEAKDDIDAIENGNPSFLYFKTDFKGFKMKEETNSQENHLYPIISERILPPFALIGLLAISTLLILWLKWRRLSQVAS